MTPALKRRWSISLRTVVSAIVWLLICAICVCFLVMQLFHSVPQDRSELLAGQVVLLAAIFLIPATFVTAIGALFGRTVAGLIVGTAVGLLVIGLIVAFLRSLSEIHT